jgi:hypothetical protein
MSCRKRSTVIPPIEEKGLDKAVSELYIEKPKKYIIEEDMKDRLPFSLVEHITIRKPSVLVTSCESTMSSVALDVSL